MPKKYLTFSYDDGVKQDLRLLELFSAHGLRGTFNLDTGRMPALPDANSKKIALCDVTEVYAGHEIATHGHMHPSYAKMTADEIRADITQNRRELEMLVGQPVTGHAYPYGSFSDTTVETLADCGIRYARTVGTTASFSLPTNLMTWHPTCHHADPNIFELADEFLAAEPKDSDLLFYIWGHSYEFDRGDEYNNWEHIEKLCKRLSGKADIEYVTNMQFLDRE